MTQQKKTFTMEATLTEIVNLGSRIQKLYSLEPSFTHDISKIEGIMLEYNFDMRSLNIIDLNTDDVLDVIDLSLYSEETPDIDFDKKILIDFLGTKAIKMYKETDDYSDIL